MPQLSVPYLLSLPERLVRALAASVGGLLFESAEVLLPRWVRRSRLYQALAYRLLRLTIELVGDVQGVLPPEEYTAGELATRKAAGNVIELAGFLTLGWSPLWLLAMAADLSGGTRAYLRLLVEELKENGLLTAETGIQSVEDLLRALETSSGAMADLVDVPPLNVQDLRDTWRNLQGSAGNLPDPGSLRELFDQLQQIARQEGRTVWSVSALLASGALRAGLQAGSTHIFQYYREALGEIHREGWFRYLRRVFRPYLVTTAGHFHPRRVTYTERLLARMRQNTAR